MKTKVGKKLSTKIKNFSIKKELEGKQRKDLKVRRTYFLNKKIGRMRK